ncbi:MAG TPA: chemotaxis protein CheW, partial [Planctomycetota bacterium]|nr:chemotaxis protein CheW [Planctomycetota bacterium]
NRGQLVQHRDRMLPLVHLGAALGIPGYIVDPEQAILVVVENRGADFVIQADAILGQRQVVIKPFDDGVAHHLATSGIIILGDGRVAIILNPAQLVRQESDTRAPEPLRP